MVSSAVPVTKTPHDALFKSVFQQPENAAAELRHVLPAEHVGAIVWSTLKLEPGSYVVLSKPWAAGGRGAAGLFRTPLTTFAGPTTPTSGPAPRPSRLGWRCG